MKKMDCVTACVSQYPRFMTLPDFSMPPFLHTCKTVEV